MAHCQLYILAFVLVTVMWTVHPVEGYFPELLGFFLHCSNDEIGSFCAECERACGQRETIDCVKTCRFGCICKTGRIRKFGICIPIAQCDERTPLTNEYTSTGFQGVRQPANTQSSCRLSPKDPAGNAGQEGGVAGGRDSWPPPCRRNTFGKCSGS
ncbi:uncharacterized protein LOC128257814 isoform X2 [Drosophila gunungcola]|uniref:uncharacterized protein LOC128257814 isoform X2 n=1 Tax=Drosophila gunungcola TaxID=103775 RepID=UPI0022E8DDEB|nr:uncharacterized protein LOC128257814 isoform X2 [Drosophila gunungcola]